MAIMSRLLLLSCSQRKKTTPGLLPAIQRYDGPMFQVLRKYCETDDAKPPVTYILSAEHALISANEQIKYYDRKMTVKRAEELQPVVQSRLREIILAESPSREEILMCLSSSYLMAIGIEPNGYKGTTDLTGADGLMPFHRATKMQGSIGKQAASLRDWLYKAPPPELKVQKQQKVKFHGVELELDADEIIRAANRKILEDPEGAGRFEAWYISVGEQKVAPKWLLNVLTGVPVSQFRTEDARRVLTQLGMKIKRIV